MKSKFYFVFNPANNFETGFQLNGGDYLMKYRVCSRLYYSSGGTSYPGTIIIESKSDISVFVKVKLYKISNQDCVLNKSSVLQIGQARCEIRLARSNGTGPFICSVKVTRYEKWQNILDSAQKINLTKNVLSSKDLITESRLDDLSSDMKRLFEQGELSDVILCNGFTDFPAHKQVLSARSKVFSKMFQQTMKLENRVTITDVPSEVFKELLIFIYTGVVTMKGMKMARDLYVAADKYDVKALRAVCSKYLKDVDLENVFDTIVLADLYEDKILKQSALDFISANYSRVKAHEKWGFFMKADQVLALEVLSFVLDNRA